MASLLARKPGYPWKEQDRPRSIFEGYRKTERRTTIDDRLSNDEARSIAINEKIGREDRWRRFIWGRRVKKGVDRVGGRKPSIFFFLFVFFLGERASDFSSFLFPWVCFRRCVTSRIFIARIRRKIDGLLTACND